MHWEIISSFVEHSCPPTGLDPAGLDALAAEHGVVLRPGTHEILVAHPFSATPTATRVDDRWWAPCLWCALGIATLCAPSATIRTGSLEFRADAPPDIYVHFPIPPRDAWNDVIGWCASVKPVASPGGEDTVPIANVATLARSWYGRHLDRDWRKWTVEEAQEHFTNAGLLGEHWRLTGSGRY